MRNNKLQTPVGVKDFLPSELFLKTDLESRILSVFHRYGYLSVCSPAFEFIDVFDCISHNTDIYKFIDDTGEILALRADMTPPIARIAASLYTKNELPLRLCYLENAFRSSENYRGKLREFTQAGIELIGSDSIEAHGEVLAIAINSMLAVGLNDFRIDIGQVDILKGLLEESKLSFKEGLQLQQLIINRDFVAAKKLFSGDLIHQGLKSFISRLPFLIGGKEVLEEAKAFVTNQKSINALEHLEGIHKLLCDNGMESYISFDLSMLGHLDYYTGLIFRGYTYGVGTSIVDGGQYDSLTEKFGANYAAVGFAIKINHLLTVLETVSEQKQLTATDTLLAYTMEAREMALKTADELRSKGLHIENSLLGDDLKANIQYAAQKSMGGVMYFKTAADVRLVNVKTGEEVDVKLKDLRLTY